MPHLVFTMFTATLLSGGMAMVEDRSTRQRLYAAVRCFFTCAMTVVGGSWLMRLIHG